MIARSQIARRGRRDLTLIWKYALLGLFTVLFIFPVYWLIISSFKTNQELFGSPWALPERLDFSNYARAFGEGSLGLYFVNSVIVTAAAVIISTLLSAMTAYGLTRLKWRLSGLVLSVFLLGMMIPTYASIVPLFSMFNRIGIINTHVAVILPHIVFALPMAILILTGFFATIPAELEEAAIIDGCTIPGAFFRIIWPTSVPSLVTVAVITFITVWNDLLFPQIFLSDSDLMTLPVGLTVFKGRYSTDYAGMVAAVVISILPSIAVYCILHEKIIDGMTAGALKE